MNNFEVNLTNSEEIFRNYAKIESDAQRARAEAIGELAGVVAAKIVNLVQKLASWNSRRAAAAQLASFDDRLLADIGIGRGEIQAMIDGHKTLGVANSNDKGRSAA
jgi:uncharacterized protein YjiS (DUF1127 family)